MDRYLESCECNEGLGTSRWIWNMHQSGNESLWESWQRVLVVGLGKTGLACARFLTARGIEVAVTDSRAHPPGLEQIQEEMPDAALFLGGFDTTAFAAADAIVVSPGVSLRESVIAAALAEGKSVLGDVDLFAASVEAPVVAITGSNGKSTVTTLVGEMARAANRRTAVGGNLGTPLLELLDDEVELYVVELSSFQLESAHLLDAAAATVLNISEDHMDRYGDLDEYCDAKARVFRGSGAMVLNADDPRVAALAQSDRRIFWFGLTESPSGYGLQRSGDETWLMRGGERLIAAAEMNLAGRHNLANALAAMALGEAIGLPREALLSALRSYTGLAHRSQWVAELGGVTWINDSKATNVGAAVAALEGFEQPVVLIAGGDAKDADLAALREPVVAHARAVVLLGKDAPELERVLTGTVPLHHAQTIEEAVRVAAGVARSGDVVLLSPACASLDMFESYRERGDRFIAAVRGLAQ